LVEGIHVLKLTVDTLEINYDTLIGCKCLLEHKTTEFMSCWSFSFTWKWYSYDGFRYM